MTYTVSIEQYELKVKITHMEVVEGNSSSWDSDWDYYGYREMEFEVVSGLVYDEDNNVEDHWRQWLRGTCREVRRVHRGRALAQGG